MDLLLDALPGGLRLRSLALRLLTLRVEPRDRAHLLDLHHLYMEGAGCMHLAHREIARIFSACITFIAASCCVRRYLEGAWKARGRFAGG